MGNQVIRVAAAILIQAGRLLITQRGEADPLAGQWEFPGGKIEPGETPRECLERELKEELDLWISVDGFVGSHIHHYDHISIELLGYRATVISGSLALNEHADYRWVTLTELQHFELCGADSALAGMLRKGAPWE